MTESKTPTDMNAIHVKPLWKEIVLRTNSKILKQELYEFYYFDKADHLEGWLLRCMTLIITCTKNLNQGVPQTPVRLLVTLSPLSGTIYNYALF